MFTLLLIPLSIHDTCDMSPSETETHEAYETDELMKHTYCAAKGSLPGLSPQAQEFPL